MKRRMSYFSIIILITGGFVLSSCDKSPTASDSETATAKNQEAYTELENQGAYQVLGPGETMKYIVTWYLVPIPKTVENKIGSHQLVDFTRNQINNK